MFPFRLNRPFQKCIALITVQVQPYSKRAFPYTRPNPLVQTVQTKRIFKSKHYDKKFRLERAHKVRRVELPDFTKNEEDEEMTPEKMTAKYKEMGIQPFPPWEEKPMYISSTSSTFDPYVPPEGDGKASLISTERAKQSVEFFGKKGKSWMSLKKIRQYEEDFNTSDFAEEALEIYIKLHEALARVDEDELQKYTTEKAFPVVLNETKNKTIRWAFHGSIEPPRCVHIRHQNVLTEHNIFGQATVRFHTQQTLAVYDRFGRLLHGSEVVLRDVLEYIVFEKHLSYLYSSWRVHEKILPTWKPLRPTSHLTFLLPEEEEEKEAALPVPEPTKEPEKAVE